MKKTDKIIVIVLGVIVGFTFLYLTITNKNMEIQYIDNDTREEYIREKEDSLFKEVCKMPEDTFNMITNIKDGLSNQEILDYYEDLKKN